MHIPELLLILFSLTMLSCESKREDIFKAQKQLPITTKQKMLLQQPAAVDEAPKISKYDYKGKLNPAKGVISGFPLPFGAKMTKMAGKLTVYRVIAPLRKLRYFYTDRNFTVFNKKKGLLVYRKNLVKQKPYLVINEKFVNHFDLIVNED